MALLLLALLPLALPWGLVCFGSLAVILFTWAFSCVGLPRMGGLLAALPEVRLPGMGCWCPFRVPQILCLTPLPGVRSWLFDFSAAFDRVNHNALIYKLRQLSIGGPFLNILIDFLTDRKQCVGVDGHYGEWRSVISGVPQGSVLGPLLFILYTHDMWIGLENQLVAYADDAT